MDASTAPLEAEGEPGTPATAVDAVATAPPSADCEPRPAAMEAAVDAAMAVDAAIEVTEAATEPAEAVAEAEA
eukprot:4914296-Prymnesium_polylepis.1